MTAGGRTGAPEPKAKAEAEAEEPPATVDPPAARGRIQLVEDNALNQMVAVAQVQQLGYLVTVAGDGIDALAELERQTFDAILMDCQMPRMDGYEASAEIRRREGNRHTPIIAVTLSAMASERDHCVAVGMDDHLPKPVRRDVLTAMLERWVGPRAAASSKPSAAAVVGR